MKLICIHRIEGEETDFYLRPDTALLRNNQPFYYPDFTQHLTVQLCRVYRIGRLGRSIAPRFALRYVEAVGTGALFTAADLLAQCIQSGKPWEPATGFDYSAAVSPEFIPFDTGILNLESRILNPELVIPAISRFLTLKIGDYIFVPTEEPHAVQRGDSVATSLDGKCRLSIEVR